MLVSKAGKFNLSQNAEKLGSDFTVCPSWAESGFGARPECPEHEEQLQQLIQTDRRLLMNKVDLITKAPTLGIAPSSNAERPSIPMTSDSVMVWEWMQQRSIEIILRTDHGVFKRNDSEQKFNSL